MEPQPEIRRVDEYDGHGRGVCPTSKEMVTIVQRDGEEWMACSTCDQTYGRRPISHS